MRWNISEAVVLVIAVVCVILGLVVAPLVNGSMGNSLLPVLVGVFCFWQVSDMRRKRLRRSRD